MEVLLKFLFPPRCVSCSQIGKYICLPCKGKIRYASTICPMCTKPSIDGSTHQRCHTQYGLDGLTCPFQYKGTVRESIKKIKYKWIFDIAKSLIKLIPNEKMPRFVIKKKPVLIPIPLHPQRKKWRGFNQSELLGKLIAEKLEIKYQNNALRRIKNTKPQTEFTRKKRLTNIKKAFLVQKNVDLSKLTNIILFDDVWTTGSTMRECVKVLKKNGARWIWGITIAR